MKLFFLFVFSFSLLQAEQVEKNPYNANDWIDLKKIHVSRHSPSQEQVIFLNTYTGVGVDPEKEDYLDSGVWHVIDISEQIPKKAKAINIGGIMIITRGLNEETANMTINFRNFEEEKEYIYQGQVIENLHSGQRSPISIWVPVTDGKFEFKWDRRYDGEYPQWASYCLNLWINAWGE